jgi:hypothetical protein
VLDSRASKRADWKSVAYVARAARSGTDDHRVNRDAASVCKRAHHVKRFVDGRRRAREVVG